MMHQEQEIQKLFESHKTFFESGATLGYSFRSERLTILRKMVADYQDSICDALRQDLGRSAEESYMAEIVTVLHEVDYHLKNLRKWMEPEKVGVSLLTFPSTNKILSRPLGTSLIIGAWNYPFYLNIMPLIGAISAGCTAILKPSEFAPATSQIIAKLVKKHFDSNYISVAEGGVEVSVSLLECSFSKIFFTGSTRVGKMVMKAASEHLSNVTLELGGKSPAIVHRDADLEVALRRIWFGKCLNAGQTCVAPDYLLIHSSLKQKFIDGTKETLSTFYPEGYEVAENYSSIINNSHYARLLSLVDGSNLLVGGHTMSNSRLIEPMLVDGVNFDHPLMKDEIFGPILPIITYETIDELFDKLKICPNPLALYLFTSDKHLENKIVSEVPFGGGCINDTILHLGNNRLPFGGIGSSGMGNYHGVRSFRAFSYEKAILNKPTRPDPSLRYPPYGRTFNWIKKFLK